MIRKKICLIGAYAVGKTSLVRRFVTGQYSPEYLTTIGAKVDQRSVTVEGENVRLLVWDLAGRDEFAAVRKSYLAGADGFIYVVDGTRRETLAEAREEMADIAALHSGVPALLLLNKHDLAAEWELGNEDLADLASSGMPVMFTSALSGENVAEAFDKLAALTLQRAPESMP